MAKEDTLGTFSQIATSRRGGSPYASAYANLAENVGDEWVDSRKLRDVMSVAQFMSQQDRAQREEQRQSFYEDLRSRGEQRRQERQDRYAARQDYQENLMDQADQLVGQIEMIDPMSADASKQLSGLRSSQNFGRLLANRQTREAVLGAFKNKAKEHDDILGGFMEEGQSKYGFKPSIEQIPVKEDRTFDTEKFYSATLPSLAEQMSQKAQAAYESAPAREGQVKVQEIDEYGRPVAKYIKAPAPPKAPKPEDIKKDFKTTYGAPPEALSMPMGAKLVKGGMSVVRGSFEDGEFKPSETGETIQVIDASKGMNKKIIHNIPYEKFESYRSKIQGSNAPSQILSAPEGINISSPIGISSSLPLPTPQATTEQMNTQSSAPQFQDGQRIRQGNAVYEIRNGQPVQVE